MKEVTAPELKRMLDVGEQFELYDIREPYEVEVATIGGRSLPMSQLVDRLDEIPKDVPVVIHCRSGSRSCAVIDALSTRYGFGNLINLRGGILAWQAEVDPTLVCE
ncbi:MAG: rhodanese-like domain-containing protein [Flavobacteriales bacterium]|jgi:rhodanese-related sulfurtransferase|nr:rhodanese-like domain-containing protein [Flavobacteriales bacterium]MBK6894253.1 rhodanese-like domain-containing protein [Flavobacteriales bacterium]MBK7248183.1 rhodanese-like domain-containing protein [Flavobacteriales bacterium]MBK7287468.1 rhodanese-like domain-containing protein [Flavobacteriales bacterium]MBK9059631.1 rhodanese-like domain-containing protein [Flavobacteriales bacterium]